MLMTKKEKSKNSTRMNRSVDDISSRAECNCRKYNVEQWKLEFIYWFNENSNVVLIAAVVVVDYDGGGGGNSTKTNTQ